MTEIRVLIADDHAVLRSGLKLLISTQSDMVVVGEAGDFISARESILNLRPNVVTLDLSMPGGNVVEVIRSLSLDVPESRIVILTMHDDVSMFRAAFAAGAAGYVVKSAADTELLTAIRTVAAGGTFINLPGNPGLPSAVPENHDSDNHKALELLSARENEVLILVAQGHTNQAIADRLLLSVKTVESYRSRLMTKLNLRTRAELTQFALKTGLMQAE